MKRIFTAAVFTLFFYTLWGQATGTIKGVVLDQQTRQPLIGVRIVMAGEQKGAITDTDGYFEILAVPVGRQSLTCQYIGYEPRSFEGIIVAAAREVFLSVELQPAVFEIGETVVSATKNAFEPVNPLSVVSTRSFTSEETERVAAGINDPGRVALSFPGVKQGPDETENAIIVRGNSPVGILWRVEGIDIPNPNHFALIGSSVGGVNVFSAQLLARSDFSTGGMAAEYGNALSGAFDMHFRNGNTEKREHRVKIGVIGIDFATEGPFRKKRSSYLINYRYSTLGLLNRLGFHLVGERVSNDFQDISFQILLSNQSRFRATVFGMGGMSLERYTPVEDPAMRDSSVFNHRNLQHKPANMGATGATFTWLLNDRSYVKTVVALMASEIRRENDTLNQTNVQFRYNTERYLDRRISGSTVYQLKVNDKTTFKTGVMAHLIFFDFYKNSQTVQSQSDVNEYQRAGVFVEGEGNTQTIQQYAQAIWRAGPRLTINGGYHVAYLNANQTWSLEPRLSLQYQLSEGSRLNLAYGIQGQMLPLMTYYFKDETGVYVNRSLKMMRAHHGVAAYHLYTQNKMKISAEAYFQRLFRVPVSPDSSDNYWMLNQTNGYPLFRVTGEGKGMNYGVDLALEKLFSRSYFVLATLSLFDSKTYGINGVARPSRWASGFTSSMTFGKEFNLRKSRVLQVGGRFLWSGGNRYTPFDPVLSAEQGRYVELSGADFSAQLPAYYRLDTRIQYRYHTSRMSGSISLDIQNATNRINASGVSYSATSNTTSVVYSSGGLIPVLIFQFDF